MKRVTGIGGIFFKAKNAERLRAWYRDHLGIAIEAWGGTVFRWHDPDRPEGSGATVWSVFDDASTYFAPSTAPFMINYRVDDLGELVEQLRAGGVEVIQGPESHENGKFAWIVDPDGNKIELWEPKLWDDKNLEP